MDTISLQSTKKLVPGVAGAVLALLALGPCMAQKPSADTSAPHEMLVTTQGFIAIDTPKGWVHSEGPGLAFFLPEGVCPQKAEVWIYISGAPVGPKEEDKDANSYIQSDTAGFMQRFKKGIVRREGTLLLPEVKQQAIVYTFQSGEAANAFEQVIYVSDVDRVLTFNLSAKNLDAFTQSTKTFHEFAKSYRGSIQMGSPEGKSN
jgi:hypothetical protein